MGWKDRATPVTKGGWRDRATPVEQGSWRDRAAPVEGGASKQPYNISNEWSPQQPGGPSGGESFIRGGGQGLTFGLQDEIYGRYRQLHGDDYETVRDEQRAANAAAQEESPWLYGGGEIGGAIATSLIPGSMALKGMHRLNTAGKFARATGLGTVEGAAYGFGAGEGETAGERAYDTAAGAAQGAVGASIGAPLGVLGRKAQERLGVKRVSGIDVWADEMPGGHAFPRDRMKRRVQERLSPEEEALEGLRMDAEVARARDGNTPDILERIDRLDEALDAAVHQTSKRTKNLRTALDVSGALAGAAISGNLAGGAAGFMGRRVAGMLGRTSSAQAMFEQAPQLKKLMQGPGSDLLGMADTVIGMSQEKLYRSVSKFGPMLEKASQRGGAAAVASTHHVLMQSDPEYQALFQGDNNAQ